MGSSVPEEVRGVRTHPSPNIKCPLLQSFFMTSYSNNLKTYSILLRVA